MPALSCLCGVNYHQDSRTKCVRTPHKPSTDDGWSSLHFIRSKDPVGLRVALGQEGDIEAERLMALKVNLTATMCWALCGTGVRRGKGDSPWFPDAHSWGQRCPRGDSWRTGGM